MKIVYTLGLFLLACSAAAQLPPKLGPSEVHRFRLTARAWDNPDITFITGLIVDEGDRLSVEFGGSMVTTAGKRYVPYGKLDQEGSLYFWTGGQKWYALAGPSKFRVGKIEIYDPTNPSANLGRIMLSPVGDWDFAAGGHYTVMIGIDRKR